MYGVPHTIQRVKNFLCNWPKSHFFLRGGGVGDQLRGQKLIYGTKKGFRFFSRADELVANMPRSVCVDHFGKMIRGLLVQLALQEYTVCVIMVGTNDINTGRSAGRY